MQKNKKLILKIIDPCFISRGLTIGLIEERHPGCRMGADIDIFIYS